MSEKPTYSFGGNCMDLPAWVKRRRSVATRMRQAAALQIARAEQIEAECDELEMDLLPVTQPKPEVTP